MKIECSDGRCRAVVEGALDIYSVAAQCKELLAGLERAPALEFDLSGVSEIDSAGFQLLALIKREGQRTQKKVSLCNHSAPVIRLLDLYRAAGIFGDPVVLPQAAA